VSICGRGRWERERDREKVLKNNFSYRVLDLTIIIIEFFLIRVVLWFFFQFLKNLLLTYRLVIIYISFVEESAAIFSFGFCSLCHKESSRVCGSRFCKQPTAPAVVTRIFSLDLTGVSEALLDRFFWSVSFCFEHGLEDHPWTKVEDYLLFLFEGLWIERIWLQQLQQVDREE
jgi:hypothetical protein